jgi:hypothetical protein
MNTEKRDRERREKRMKCIDVEKPFFHFCAPQKSERQRGDNFSCLRVAGLCVNLCVCLVFLLVGKCQQTIMRRHGMRMKARVKREDQGNGKGITIVI